MSRKRNGTAQPHVSKSDQFLANCHGTNFLLCSKNNWPRKPSEVSNEPTLNCVEQIWSGFENPDRKKQSSKSFFCICLLYRGRVFRMTRHVITFALQILLNTLQYISWCTFSFFHLAAVMIRESSCRFYLGDNMCYVRSIGHGVI